MFMFIKYKVGYVCKEEHNLQNGYVKYGLIQMKLEMVGCEDYEVNGDR